MSIDSSDDLPELFRLEHLSLSISTTSPMLLLFIKSLISADSFEALLILNFRTRAAALNCDFSIALLRSVSLHYLSSSIVILLFGMYKIGSSICCINLLMKSFLASLVRNPSFISCSLSIVLSILSA